MGDYGYGHSGRRNPNTEFTPSAPHPYDVAIALCMGLQRRLGEKSLLHILDQDVVKEITEQYRSWFWTRPWTAHEAADLEAMWLRGRDVQELRKQFWRNEDDMKVKLDILDTKFTESEIREFERGVMRGFIICDVENYGGIVQRSRTSIMPGNYGIPGNSEELGHFTDLPGRIRRKLINRRALHDPENVLGHGHLSLTAMP